jgi:hypothetical protein
MADLVPRMVQVASGSGWVSTDMPVWKRAEAEVLLENQRLLDEQINKGVDIASFKRIHIPLVRKPEYRRRYEPPLSRVLVWHDKKMS